jgi:hypothetical protein
MSAMLGDETCETCEKFERAGDARERTETGVGHAAGDAGAGDMGGEGICRVAESAGAMAGATAGAAVALAEAAARG